MPITMAHIGVTKPEAGVMQTSPATRPEQRPGSWACRGRSIHAAQVRPPAAAARCVAAKALAARPPAPRSVPALKPNQPTHSRQAPTAV